MIDATLGDQFTPTGNEVSFFDGKYLLRKKIGRGAFGDIYFAFDTIRRKPVALKMENIATAHRQLQQELLVYLALNAVTPSFTSEVHQPHQCATFMGEMAKSDAPSPSCGKGNAGEHHAGSVNHDGPVASPQEQQQPNGGRGERKSTENVLAPTSKYLAKKKNPTPPGFPRVHYFGKEGEYNVMVLDLCGPNLENLFNYSHRRFSLKTVLMLIEQILYRVEYLHSTGYLHGDIKPENFVLGKGPTGHIVHMLDFGLSKSFINRTSGEHIPFATNKPLSGTARFCSTNVHRGFQQGRRDDLEALGFLFIYFIKGVLPWQGMCGNTVKEKAHAVGEKKKSTSVETLCAGLPAPFATYLHYCRKLLFQEDPNYHYLRQIFRGLWKDLDLSSYPRDGSVTANGLGFLSSPLSSPFLYVSANDSSIVSPSGFLGGGGGGNSLKKITNIGSDKAGGNHLNSNTVNNNSNNHYNQPHNSSNAPTNARDGGGGAAQGGASITSQPSQALRGVSPISGVSLRECRLAYDWHFDWLVKRYQEVQQHKASKRAERTEGGGTQRKKQSVPGSV